MPESRDPGAGDIYRFGNFELDVAAYQLRRAGRRVRIERRPMDLLILMVERRGGLVSRSEIIDRLWGKDVFIEVDTAVHTAVRKIRHALGDSPEAASYLETIPGKGYRFVAQVEVVATSAIAQPPPPSPEPPAQTFPPRVFRHDRLLGRPLLAVGLLTLVLLGGFVAWRWRSEGVASPVMLAVLPFANLSDDPNREYLADGLAEELIASLGQAAPERLRVVGRTSMLAYKRTTKSLAQIGKELNVDYLVEGSVRTDSDRMRITAKLIQVNNQTQVWSSSYDREFSDMLAFQRELSAAIAGQVTLQLSPVYLDALARRQTQDAAAYDLYLRGISISQRRTPDANLAALDYYDRATSRDPRYALAWAGAGTVHASMSQNSDVPPLTAGPRALAAAKRAFELDPELAEVQFLLGYIHHLFDWDWQAAERSYRRAIVINPGLSAGHRMLGHLLSQMRRHGEAREEMRRAVALDPFNPMNHAISSQVAFQARAYPAAVDHATRTVTLDPEFWIGHMQLAQAYEQLGTTDLALGAAMKGAQYSRGNSKTLSLRGYLLAKSGRRDQAREVLGTLEEISRTHFVPPYALALVHAGLGDSDAVFEWLAKAYDARDVHLVFLTVDPKWDPYRTDPRFAALLARCGFAIE